MHGAAVGQARLRAGLVLLMLPGVLSSPGPALSSAEKGATEKVPPLLPVLSSPYRDRRLSPHPRYPCDAPRWRGEPCALIHTETRQTTVMRSSKWMISPTAWLNSIVQKELILCFHANTFHNGRGRWVPVRISRANPLATFHKSLVIVQQK